MASSAPFHRMGGGSLPAALLAAVAALAPLSAGCRRLRVSGQPPEAIGQQPAQEPAYEVSGDTAPSARPIPELRPPSERLREGDQPTILPPP